MRDPLGAGVVRFGVFEVDLRCGELRKRGVRVPLQQQPFRMLVRLLERPGDVVTREALRQELWPADTFVDFEQGVNAAVRRLRDALGDSAESPRFIETLPRRGYRFVAPVQSDRATLASDAPAPDTRPRRHVARWLLAGVAVVLIGAATVEWRARRRPLMTQTDLIVLADFDNHTTESVLTGTMKQALAVKLAESHLINLLSEDRVRETLTTMRRKPDEPLTEVLAREVCQRTGARATLSGAVTSVGSSYVISFTATSCSTGETLAQDQSQAARKEEILRTLGGMAVRLRRRLGESLRAIQAANTPLERATTSSLEALKAFTEGESRFLAGAQLEAIPFYKRAIELDPDFAMAHAKLGLAYNLVGSAGLIPHLTRAFELRERLTERERFYVTGHYHSWVRQDLESALPVYQIWKASYPQDAVPYNGLGFLYARQGHLERALAEFEGAARVAPSRMHRSVLFVMYLRFGRGADAKDLLDRQERETGTPIRYGRFLLAFQQRNLPAVELHGSVLRNDEGELDNPDAERARAAAFFGRMRRAREFFADACTTHEGTGFAQNSALLKLEEALWEAETGNCPGARDRAAEAWTLDQGRPVRTLMTIALAECGDVARAEKLSQELNTSAFLDRAARARIDLTRGRFKEVLERLKPSGSGDLAGLLMYSMAGQHHGLAGAYLRGRARLDLNQGREAAAEFQKILDHPGLQGFAPYQALAPLYLARAYASAGDVQRSRGAYEQFLSLWKDADPDIPILRAARQEYARLAGS